MKLRIILMATAGMCLSHGVYAQSADQCTIAPTCAELGYQQKAADCNGQRTLKCPFDQTQVFCGGTACSEDFKLSACDSSLGTCSECGGKYKYTKCNSGWTLSSGNCVASSCDGYPFSSPPSGCNSYSSCKSGNSSKYRCSSCPNGCYELYNGRCYQYKVTSVGELGDHTGYKTCISNGTTYYWPYGCDPYTGPGNHISPEHGICTYDPFF